MHALSISIQGRHIHQWIESSRRESAFYGQIYIYEEEELTLRLGDKVE
jgi:hypothetical protein